MECLQVEIEKLWEKGKNYLKECGAEIIDISLPHTNYALAHLLYCCSSRGII